MEWKEKTLGLGRDSLRKLKGLQRGISVDFEIDQQLTSQNKIAGDLITISELKELEDEKENL
ncbi:MAG: hypothetical protein ACE5IW_03925 [bacterium]